MKYEMTEGNYAVLGVIRDGESVIFTFVAEKEDCCSILLYPRGELSQEIQLLVPQQYHRGRLYSVRVFHLPYLKYNYNYKINETVRSDPYARKIIGREIWGDSARVEDNAPLQSGFFFPEELCWDGDKKPMIKREEMFLYKLHVRGYTMDSNAKDRGTFHALQKKIPYLKELGVTSVELMPLYEFEENQWEKKKQLPDYVKKEKQDEEAKGRRRINFWGYGSGDYFAPKASYAYSADAAEEIKNLIIALHKNNMECILELFFPKGMNTTDILSILHFWVMRYHVDGFHLQGEDMPVSVLAQDYLLSETKIGYTWFDEKTRAQNKNHLLIYNEEFVNPLRRMLCGKEANLYEFANQMRKQRTDCGSINYIADNNGFSLLDLFSYSEKHNEDNGENNLDGNDWNYSCNCGIEGETRQRYVRELRKKLMRNALTAVFLAQGIPLLFSGDEFGNSKWGNNNAYCQDNVTGWVNWKQKEKNKDVVELVKQLVSFRREHPVLSMTEPMQMYDYKGIGFPDLSYHGEEAWLSDFAPNRQAFGILYAGGYAKKADGTADDNIYLAFNFHQAKKMLALPLQEKGKEWYCVFDTAEKKAVFGTEKKLGKTLQLELAAQSVVLLVGK